MSVKVALSGISEFLELALLPIKLVLGRPVPPSDQPASRKVVLINPAQDGVSLENSVCLGELDACRNAAVELMLTKRKLALEGFHIDEIAELCFKHNYRWRFDDRPSKRSRFIVEPGIQSPSADDPHRSPRPKSAAERG